MPDADYRNYNLDGVRIKRATFSDNSILPSCEIVLNICASFSRVKLPVSSLENIHYTNKQLDKHFLKRNSISLESLYILNKLNKKNKPL